MNVQIECPKCSRRFQGRDELYGRTVECGACDHRFSVTEDTIIQERKKFYPGELADTSLERFGRAPVRDDAPVTFQTAQYNQCPDTDIVQPAAPIQAFAALSGITLILVFSIIFLVTTGPGQAFTDVDHFSRMLLGGFISLLGCGLLIYGAKSWRGRALFISTLLIIGLYTLIVIRPVHTTPSTKAANNSVATIEIQGSEKNDEEIYLQKIGYKKIQEFIERETDTSQGIKGNEHVMAIYAHPVSDTTFNTLEEHLRKSLALNLKTPIHSYKRNDLKDRLIIISGPKLSLNMVERACSGAGTVVPLSKHRLIDLTINQAAFTNPTPEEIEKLKNLNHELFCASNLSELDNIQSNRRQDAADRLSKIPELFKMRYSTDIATKLSTMVITERDSDLVESAGAALQKWGINDPSIVKNVETVVVEKIEAGKAVPKSVVEFLILGKSNKTLFIIDRLWVQNPTTWTSYYEAMGSRAEDRLVTYLNDSSPELRSGAVDILKRVGTSKSIPALTKALSRDNEGIDISIQRAIDSIKSR